MPKIGLRHYRQVNSDVDQIVKTPKFNATLYIGHALRSQLRNKPIRTTDIT
jgi:hypothetical protein